jgi:hypothetical protein
VPEPALGMLLAVGCAALNIARPRGRRGAASRDCATRGAHGRAARSSRGGARRTASPHEAARCSGGCERRSAGGAAGLGSCKGPSRTLTD